MNEVQSTVPQMSDVTILELGRFRDRLDEWGRSLPEEERQLLETLLTRSRNVTDEVAAEALGQASAGRVDLSSLLGPEIIAAGPTWAMGSWSQDAPFWTQDIPPQWGQMGPWAQVFGW
jgi:hypothetical protein